MPRLRRRSPPRMRSLPYLEECAGQNHSQWAIAAPSIMCSNLFRRTRALAFQGSISSPAVPSGRRAVRLGKFYLRITGAATDTSAIPSLAERRVIPAAAKVAAIDEISMPFKSRPQAIRCPSAGASLAIITSACWKAALDIVYRSLPNAMQSALGCGSAWRRQTRHR